MSLENTIQTPPSDTIQDHRKFHVTHLRVLDYSASNPVASPLGGITLAFLISEEKKPSGHPIFRLSYGLSVCNPSDRYDKFVGRLLASQKAIQAKKHPEQSLFGKDDPYAFLGTGNFTLDITPEMVSEGELTPSRYVHKCIVKSIIENAVENCGYANFNHAVSSNYRKTTAWKVRDSLLENLLLDGKRL